MHARIGCSHSMRLRVLVCAPVVVVCEQECVDIKEEAWSVYARVKVVCKKQAHKVAS